jgi:hypothetical protein
MRLFDRFAMGVLCDPVTASAGGIGLVGNLAGGLIGSGAAKKAAAAQAAAAQAASDKVGAAVGQANAPIADATRNAQDLATTGANRVIDTAGAAKAGMDEQAKNANAILDPYSTAGTTAATALNSQIGEGGDFNKKFTAADLQMDPGYAWRQQQAELALSRSAAARGGAISGSALTDMNSHIQGMASNEFQNAFQRYQTDTTNRYDRLFGTSQLGERAGAEQGQNLTNAARYGGDITTGAANTALGANEYAGTAGMQGATTIGGNVMKGATTQADLLTQKGNAQASGIMGPANAWSSALAGGANSVSAALLNPALTKPKSQAVRV